MEFSKTSWAGTDLVPLPFESTVSCLWRFAWRNKLNAHQLKCLCSWTESYPQKDFFDKQDWINQNLFLKKSTWTVPIPDELEFIQYLHMDERVWVDRTFRYCPLCLEHGYHSFLFQFIPISHCPLHNVALAKQCHCCDEPLPMYGFSKSLFDSPYHCRQCRGPISGVKPSLDLHLPFRLQGQELETAFRPIMDWWKNTLRKRLDAYELDPRSNIASSRIHEWCDNKDIIRSIVCAGSELPPYFNPPKNRGVAMLSWRLKVYKFPLSYYAGGARRSFVQQVRLPDAVYQCVLRRVQRWIMNCENWSAKQFHEEMLIDRGKNVHPYNARLLALRCMRWQLEKGNWYCQYPSQGGIMLRDVPSVKANLSPRLAWLAAFLAIYVSWYYRVLKARNKTLDDLQNRNCSDDAYIFLHARFQGEDGFDYSIGTAAIPPVEGLTLSLTRRR